MSESIATVFVVDDDDAVRDAILMLLASTGMRAAGFASADEFLESFDPLQPGCLVLDVRMPGMSGIELQRHLNELSSLLPIIFVTGHGDVPMAVDAIKAGAVEFLQKPFNDEDLLQRVERALAASDERYRAARDEREHHAQLEQLTPREKEVCGALLDGSTTKQIAYDLSLSPRTVEIHRARVLHKLGVRSVVELVRIFGPAQTP